MTPADRESKLEALQRWQAQFPPAALRQLSFALLDVSNASSRATVQFEQAQRRPNDAREAEQAVRSLDRLNECIKRYNAEVYQLKNGTWPA